MVDFHSLCQLLHSQVYHDDLKLWTSNDEICIDNCDWLISSSHITKLNEINEGEANKKLPKVFPGQILQMTQKTLTHWFNKKKRPDAVCLK